SDATDTEFEEALEQAKRDPELARWFEAHCARQSLVRKHLKQVPVPEELRQRILEHVDGHSTIVWWRHPMFHALAAAAGIILVAGLVWLWTQPGRGNRFADYRDQVVRGVQRFYDMNNMDRLTNNLTEIRAFLARNSAPSDYVLTRPMENLPGIGCNILQWRSNKVSLVCLDSGNTNILYFFVVDRSAVSDPPPTGAPQFVRIRKLMSASWSEGNRVYILAAGGEEDVLRRFL
ncbi:MAG TPA: hypothetical protein VJW76_10065, partial [Verrucomicrobiae bacterium]|nr:hypothetical protein [Verrucomicrobiae bacterium]